MEKYSKILIYIFILCFLNLGISSYLIYKVTYTKTPAAKIATAVTTSPSPIASNKPMATDEIRTDLTLIKAELRSLRELLGITGSFEELTNLIKTFNQTEKP